MNKKSIETVFSKKSDHWQTPERLYNLFNEYAFYDPCPYMSKKDNLKEKWQPYCFINPPYSQIKIWINTIIEKLEKNEIEVLYLLIPSRTDTKYFHRLVSLPYKIDVVFIKGRLKFSNSNSAPFPSCLIRIQRDINIIGIVTYYLDLEETLYFIKLSEKILCNERKENERK